RVVMKRGAAGGVHVREVAAERAAVIVEIAVRCRQQKHDTGRESDNAGQRPKPEALACQEAAVAKKFAEASQKKGPCAGVTRMVSQRGLRKVTVSIRRNFRRHRRASCRPLPPRKLRWF